MKVVKKLNLKVNNYRILFVLQVPLTILYTDKKFINMSF